MEDVSEEQHSEFEGFLDEGQAQDKGIGTRGKKTAPEEPFGFEVG